MATQGLPILFSVPPPPLTVLQGTCKNSDTLLVTILNVVPELKNILQNISIYFPEYKKFRTYETPNCLMCADLSTNTKTDTQEEKNYITYVTSQISHVMCHVSHVMCHMSHVTFRVSPVTNAHSHRPSPC